jgi:hypothetical protein
VASPADLAATSTSRRSRSARREGKRFRTARLLESSRLPQAAISSIVRRHPAHQPVAGSIVQTFVQGLGISLAIDDKLTRDCQGAQDDPVCGRLQYVTRA